jgi:DNA-binding FadR family transcriptional regulator
VLEARETTLADFTRGVWLIEPAVMGLVASRIGAAPLERIRQLEPELGASIEDTGRFLRTWEEAAAVAFSATRNPALTVITEILHWVRVAVEPALTADAQALPGVSKSNRKAYALFVELVSALTAHDSERAQGLWAALQELATPFVEEQTELGGRLVIDLVG